jgi:hypothetical protein
MNLVPTGGVHDLKGEAADPRRPEIRQIEKKTSVANK